MSEAIAPLPTQPTDTEILDFLESEVISVSSHPLGWSFLIDDGTGNPRIEDGEVWKGECFREVVAQVMRSI